MEKRDVAGGLPSKLAGREQKKEKHPQQLWTVKEQRGKIFILRTIIMDNMDGYIH